MTDLRNIRHNTLSLKLHSLKNTTSLSQTCNVEYASGEISAQRSEYDGNWHPDPVNIPRGNLHQC